MNEQMRSALTPQEYILRMFAETEDGKFKTEYKRSENGSVEERTFCVSWSAEDAEKIAERYRLLTSALARIGRLHRRLTDEKSRKSLLSKEELEVWNTYVRPYEPMEVNWDELDPLPPCEPGELTSLIEQICERSRLGDLIEEEELLWKRYCMWNEEQSQKRIPFHRRSCADLITMAAHFEGLIRRDAPKAVVDEAGRRLAEEMVLYYFGKEEPIVWE